MENKCDKCEEGIMVVRKGRYGDFLACNQYPDCDNTKKIASERDKEMTKVATVTRDTLIIRQSCLNRANEVLGMALDKKVLDIKSFDDLIKMSTVAAEVFENWVLR